MHPQDLQTVFNTVCRSILLILIGPVDSNSGPAGYYLTGTGIAVCDVLPRRRRAATAAWRPSIAGSDR